MLERILHNTGSSAAPTQPACGEETRVKPKPFSWQPSQQTTPLSSTGCCSAAGVYQPQQIWCSAVFILQLSAMFPHWGDGRKQHVVPSPALNITMTQWRQHRGVGWGWPVKNSLPTVLVRPL